MRSNGVQTFKCLRILNLLRNLIFNQVFKEKITSDYMKFQGRLLFLSAIAVISRQEFILTGQDNVISTLGLGYMIKEYIVIKEWLL